MAAIATDLGESQDKADRYLNASQQVLIAVVEYLGQHLLEPRRLQDVAEALAQEYKRDAIFRTLQTLQAVGWVDTLGAGYILSPDLTRLADRLRLKLIGLNRLYLENSHESAYSPE